MKLLEGVLPHDFNKEQTLFNSDDWAKAGFGPVVFTTAGKLARDTKTTFDTTMTDNKTNAADDVIGKFYNFLDSLYISLHDYPSTTNDVTFKGGEPHDGRRPADVRESVENYKRRPTAEDMVGAAFSTINEATLYEVGRLYEAKVVVRGVQKEMKVFYPTMSPVSKRKLQEDLNKVLPNAVVLNYSPLAGTNTIKKSPVIIVENGGTILIGGNVLLHEEQNVAFVVEKDEERLAELRARIDKVASAEEQHEKEDDRWKDKHENHHRKLEARQAVEDAKFRGMLKSHGLVKESYKKYLEVLKEGLGDYKSPVDDLSRYAKNIEDARDKLYPELGWGGSKRTNDDGSVHTFVPHWFGDAATLNLARMMKSHFDHLESTGLDYNHEDAAKVAREAWVNEVNRASPADQSKITNGMSRADNAKLSWEDLKRNHKDVADIDYKMAHAAREAWLQDHGRPSEKISEGLFSPFISGKLDSEKVEAYKNAYKSAREFGHPHGIAVNYANKASPLPEDEAHTEFMVKYTGEKQ